jgi:hypothetical protein
MRMMTDVLVPDGAGRIEGMFWYEQAMERLIIYLVFNYSHWEIKFTQCHTNNQINEKNR